MGLEVLSLYWVVAGRPVVYPLTYDHRFVNQNTIERYHILWEWYMGTETPRRK